MTRDDELRDGHCVTCSDEGVPMRVVGRGDDGLARLRGDDGRRSDVMTDLVGAGRAGRQRARARRRRAAALERLPA